VGEGEFDETQDKTRKNERERGKAIEREKKRDIHAQKARNNEK